MNNIFEHLGLSGNVTSLNSSEKWINFQSEVGSQRDTKVSLVSFEGTKKRKRKDIDGATVSGRHPLVPVLQFSPNPPETSNRNNSTVSMAFSPYVADEEFSVNQDLNLQLKLDIEDAHSPKAHTFVPPDDLVIKPVVNLELSLSVGQAISAVTSEVGTLAPRYYMAHGGGQRCENEDCQNGIEGKTMYLKLHGGGQQSEQLDCIKSAEGSSKFCIGHDGGRRCRQAGSTTVSRRKFGLCAAHSALVQDLRVHGGQATGTPISQKPAAQAKTDQMKMIAVQDSYVFSSNSLNQRMNPIIPAKPGAVSLPEGRVHGGSLMTLPAKGAPLNQFENQG